MEGIIRIDYAADTRDALEAMYDIKDREEVSPSSLATCRRAIEKNPSGYTAWQLYDAILHKTGTPSHGLL